MKKSSKIAIFKGRKIRRYWNEKDEKWYFSVVDVVAVLSGSVDPRKYWNELPRLYSRGILSPSTDGLRQVRI